MKIYLLVINIFSFILYGLDKLKAKYHWWRISEKTLLLTSFLGGAYGSYLAMKLFRHKTRKTIFSIGVPVMIVLETICIYYWWKIH